MEDNRLLIALALAGLLAISAFLPAARADFNVQLQGDTFRVTWTINASQNMTIYTHQQVFPSNLTSILSGSDLSAFQSALQTAVQQKTNSATVSDLAVTIHSNNANTTCTTTCAPQWMNATATFNVHEAVSQTTGVGRYDLGWTSAKIAADLETGGVSINRLGEKYLVPALLPFAQFKSSATDTMTFTINGFPALRTNYQSQTTPIVLFDMSQLTTPVESWSYTWSLGSNSQTWSSPQSGGYSVAAVETITEAGTSTSIAYLSSARVAVTISAPLNARANSNQLLIDLSGGFWDQLALIIVVVCIIALAASLILDWRLTGSSQAKRKTRKK